MCRAAVTVLVVAASHAWGAEDFVFPMNERSWSATPGWTSATKAKTYAHTFADGVAAFKAAGGGGTMVWARHFSPARDITGLRYLTLRYRCRHVNPDLRSYFLFLTDRSDSRMTSDCLALAASHLVADGRWRVLTTSLKIHKQLTAAAIRFQAVEGEEAVVEISHLAVTRRRPRFPIAHYVAWRPGQAKAPDESVGVERATKLAAVQKALAVSDWFTAERVEAAGLPFRVALKGGVALSTPVKEKQTVTIPVGRRMKSLWLLMGAELSPRILTYDAWQPGDSIDQPERFCVTNVYADGSTDRQLPYCVDMAEHAIWRGLHVYEIALGDKPVKEIQVRDGMRTSAFHIVALTAGARRVAPKTPEQWPWPSPGPAPKRSLLLEKGRLHGAVGRLRFGASPLFRIREGERTWTSDDFTWTSQTEGACEAAKLAVRLALKREGNDSVVIELSVENRAAKTRFATVMFPEANVTIDGPTDDLWCFLQRSCGVLSNRDNKVLRSAYGGRFPLQWVDFFDRRQGGGVTVGTRSRSARHRWYEGGKRSGKGVARVEHLDNIPLPPGQPVAYPPAFVATHGGDWHAAFDAYRRWRATWHKPQKPRLDWFRKTWHLRTHWVRTLPHRGKVGLPEFNWLDPATRRLRAAHFVDKDRELFGLVDYVHLFDWRISDRYGRWGDYRHYADIGGLPEFRRAIQAAQAKGVRVGLYLDTYLVSRKSLVGRRHGLEWATHRRNGRVGDGYSTKADPMYNMCVSHPGWQDYLAKTCARVASETDCDGIYLDEGGMDLPQYWCWRTDHGHPAPATTIAGQRVLFEKVRAALPDRVALYTEYTPPDVLVPHLDGAYMASLRTTDLRRSPGYLNISRFAFPDFKVFVIPNAGSMFDGIYDGLVYSLFNGVALYSLSWGHDDEAYPLCRKIGRILKDHEDAFSTLAPEPFAPTLRNQVYANRFPGENQTVWTLWNARFRTVRGPMLQVEHKPGARYRDVWNGRDLTPTIKNGRAQIELQIGPRGIGVVARTNAP